MKRIINLIKKNIYSNFFQSISILVGGTTLAQLLNILALPIVTRLYTPEQFSIFAFYVSLLSILSVICCLRFEIGIPIVKSDEEAVSLSLIAILTNLAFFIVLCLIIFLFSDFLIHFIDKIQIFTYIWWLPIGVLFTGFFTIFQYYITRKKQYILIAKIGIFQSGIGIIMQILLALLGYGVIGLILGQITKSSLGTINLAKSFWRDFYFNIKKEKLDNLYKIFRKNIYFPKYSVPEALANTASIQLPILFIAFLSIDNQAGFLMLAIQLLSIPITFIGRAVSQVYSAEAPSKVRDNEIGVFTINILRYLLYFGVNILIFLGVLSPIFVKYIFGQQWAEMGTIISWMIPWFIFQLIASPISMIMYIENKQKQMLMLTIFGLVLKIMAIYIQYILNPNYLVHNFAISSAVFYFIACIVFLNYARVSLLDIVRVFREIIVSYLFVSITSYLLLIYLKYLGV